MGFSVKSAVLLLAVVFAVADASALSRLLAEAHKRQVYGGPNADQQQAAAELFAKLGKLQTSGEKIAEQIGGFERQFTVFFEQLSAEYGKALMGYANVIGTLVEATPAPAVKTFALDTLRTTKSALIDITHIYKDYNPLHPKKFDRPGPFRRTLTTLGTFGDAVNEFLDDADSLIVHFMDEMFIDQAEEMARSLDGLITYLGLMEPDVVKITVLQGLKP